MINLTFRTTAILILLLTACSVNPNKKPPKESDGEGEQINMQIFVAPNANLNILGQPAPIRVDFYQLSADGAFGQAGFSDLIQQPETVLAEKLIQRDQYIFYPDTITVLPTKLDSNLRYFGAIASYRDLENKQWRITLLKQERPWYRFRKNYLYLYITNTGVQQLSREEMHEKLQEYQERHPNDRNIRNGKAYPEQNNWDKGIFRQIQSLRN